MSIIDLSLLPAPAVIEEIDFEDLYQQMLDDFRTAMGEGWTAVLESDPVTKLLEVAAYRELLLRARVNDAARAIMLAFATGSDLDQIAAAYDEQRLVVQQADPTAVPPLEEIKEGDTSLRNRVQLAFEKLSVAGPRKAYVAHALGADGRVADVTAISPEPCEVLVSVLSIEGDGTASAEVLQAVEATLNDEDVRPVGDRVTVQSAQIIPYSVAAVLYLYPGPEAELVRSAAEQSLQGYIAAQRRLGRDIRLSAVYAALHVEGVQRVELTQPVADVVLNETQASYCDGFSIVVGGADE
ncbi:baseplate assembly protein [Pseudomonas citronellolis]|uniref:baseplate assembly protein n=1 Tax=Pseudomonas citronellolis TaxID=53408 RepID=UPI002D7912B5|nr:baseplate J/gp47 family protein [Pseudomonas citronellolis]WRT82735.1 baseplate J/gp47 family protein [Pseudomonas citronellolis]